MPKIIPVQLKKNIYGRLINPLVNAYQFSQPRKPNPWEQWLIATLLQARLESWGSKLPKFRGDLRGNKLVQGLNSPAASAIMQARSNGLAQVRDAWNSSRVQSLIQSLEGLKIDQSNAWQDFNFAVNYFMTKIYFIDYFTLVYKDGASSKFFTDSLNIWKHPDSNEKGVMFTSPIDGSGVVGTRGKTTMQIISTDATIDGLYWIMYTGLTTADCAWVDGGFGTGAPVVVIPGVTITYRQMVINTLGTPDAVAGEIVTAFGGIPGYASVVQTLSNEVTFTIATGGLLPASDFTGLVGGTSNWVGGEIPGVDPVAGDAEVFDMNFNYSDDSLADRFFIVSDLAGDTTLVWYDLDGGGTIPPKCSDCPSCNSCVLDYTAAVSVAITTGMTPTEILDATKTVLDGLALFTLEVTGLRLKATYLTIGDIDDVDAGTSTIGVNYKYFNEIKASDGSVLANDVENDRMFADYWNSLKLPAERILGSEYPFLNPNILTNNTVGTGGPAYRGAGGLCSCQGVSSREDSFTGNYPEWPNGSYECASCIFGGGVASGMFIASNQNTWIDTAKAGYNKPGSIFDVTSGRQAIPTSEIV